MQDATRYYIGVGGWEHDILDGCFYPDDTATSARKLAWYARWFNTVEVRPTFWDDTLNEDDAREWLRAVDHRKEFAFMVKLHASFTHSLTMGGLALRNTGALLDTLREQGRLGGVLAQFPYSFTNTGAHRQYLEKLAIRFNGFPLHVELRHASWDHPGLYALLNELRVSPVNSDLPRIRQLMPYLPRTTGDQAYLRLHGRNEKAWMQNTYDGRYDYLYNGREMQEVRRRIFALPQGCTRAFILWNNTTGGKAVANALQCVAMVRGSGAIPIPSASLRAFPVLRDIARTQPPDAQLFSDQYREAM